ncbi:glycosyltransferase family 2 protein [bacterium]|nr:glycosyltransferase family 2 protein [bacterium]
MKKITVLIPVYNELNTFLQLLKKVETTDYCGLEKEIIIIDDYSTDGTRELYKEIPYKVILHEYNQGKGAALRTGFKAATGDIIIIQDADLEYNPEDYNLMLPLILEDKADVVFGSRLANKENLKNFLPLSLIANKTLTFITNILFNVKLTDMETCFKALKKEYADKVEITSNRFDFEPEITVKVLKAGARLKEVPISYNGRIYDEGKKVTWKDGLHAILVLFKFKFFSK